MSPVLRKGFDFERCSLKRRKDRLRHSDVRTRLNQRARSIRHVPCACKQNGIQSSAVNSLQLITSEQSRVLRRHSQRRIKLTEAQKDVGADRRHKRCGRARRPYGGLAPFDETG